MALRNIITRRVCHDGPEPSIVMKKRLAQRVATEAEPGRILILAKLGFVLSFRASRIKNFSHAVQHERISLLVRLAVP